MHLETFKKTINDYYKKHKRPMAWRETTDPYKIFVSEVMLQQTQVSRVAVKYEEFIKIFDRFIELSDAKIEKVLKIWSGMGYYRRALFLKKSAEVVMDKYSGKLPSNPLLLDELPGIGYATAHSIATFAYNYPGVFIETNIRRVFIHFFFNDKDDVDDKEILPLVEKTLDVKNPREWYYALMDYGTMLAKTENANVKSRHYTIQSKFEGSGRQMRGSILKELIKAPLTYSQLLEKLSDEPRLKKSLTELQKEGFIMEEKSKFKIK
jgi:A/G-specific adenine glycosylase